LSLIRDALPLESLNLHREYWEFDRALAMGIIGIIVGECEFIAVVPVDY